MRIPVWTALLALFVVTLAPSHAAAEQGLSLGGGFATFTADEDRQPVGGYMSFGWQRRLGDSSYSVRAEAVGGLYSEGGIAASGHAVFGFAYAFDVLKYVPYATLGAGALFIGGETLDEELMPMVELGAGFDILSSRRFSYGLAARAQYLFGDTALFTLGVRATWSWGFF